MKRFLLPALCAVLLVACDTGERIAKANDTVGASPGTHRANTNGASPASSVSPEAKAAATTPPPSDPPPSRISVRTKPAPELPAPVAEVVQLAQTTLGDSVLIHFIEALHEPFTLNADQVIYLNDIGFGIPVLNALLTKAASSPAVTAVQQGVASAPPAPAAPGANPGEAAAPVAPGNVLPTNDPGSISNGLGFPGGPAAEARAPVYSAPQPGSVETTTVVAPSEPVTYNTFYSGLSSYGNWVQDGSYGWCWQPTVVVVNPAWQPYSDGGRWLWSDYGWYWHSSYSWGWAPFHYGRWHQAPRLGWVWSPGSDWGPAWVAWRQSDAYCGWAPLPPEAHWRAGIGFSWYGALGNVSIGFGLQDDSWFACPWDRFSAQVLPPFRLSHHELRPFIHNSRQIIAGDNSVNIIGNNNLVVINNGVSRDQVQRHTREEIRKVALMESSTPGAAAQRVATGSTANRPEVATFRPRLAPENVQPVAPPAAILARQEARKNGVISGVASGNPVPSRPYPWTPATASSPRATAPTTSVTPGVRPAFSTGTSPGSAPGFRANPNTVPVRRAEVGVPLTPAPSRVTPSYTQGTVPSRGTGTPPGGQPYNQPGYNFPAGSPARPNFGANPSAGQPVTRPYVSANPVPAFRQEPTVLNRVPSARFEERKYPVPSPLYGRPAGVGAVPSGNIPGSVPFTRYEPPTRPTQGYIAPARPVPTYNIPGSRPIPAFDSRRDVAPFPVARPELRNYAPAPAFRSYQPAPNPAPAFRSYQPAPSPAPAFRSYQPAPSPAPPPRSYQPAPGPAPPPRSYQPAPGPAPLPASRPDPGRSNGNLPYRNRDN